MYWGFRPGGAFSNQVGTRLCGGRNLNSDRIGVISVKKLIGDKTGDKSPLSQYGPLGLGTMGHYARRKLHNLRAEKAKPSIFRGDYESCNATAPLYNFMYCEIILSLAWSKILKNNSKVSLYLKLCKKKRLTKFLHASN